VFLLRHYSARQFINIGTGDDVAIADFAARIARLVGFTGRILFDPARPDGVPRKVMDVSRLAALGWRAPTGLDAALAQYYRWYLAHESQLRR
jgi:GDP-L-fucose synthase